ncbi:hypothetical protein GIB67_020020 [Kingdonia uniflora]|uniref:Uncharacterized protein n=1 Tax=Kingdonia uniflora TaxID=39325 RepID=A0A7J7NF19_9MAGN|nr:hypothetical protein GIB67_020020 [Kingdonia uniflora]
MALPFSRFVSQLLTVVGYGIREDEVADPRDKVIDQKYWEKSRKYMVAESDSESEEGSKDSEGEAEPAAVGQAAASRTTVTTILAASTGLVPHDIASLYTYMESQFGQMNSQFSQINSQFQLFCEDIGWLQTCVDDLSSVVQNYSSGPPIPDPDEQS